MAHRRQQRRFDKEQGVTLLELMIAISLVAMLSTGMMLALRTSVQAYGKTGQRLESNRRTVGREQILSNQIGSAMAVTALCGVNGSGVSFLSGGPAALRLVSSYSITEGARGYPQIVEYRVLPAPDGSVRLVVHESAYTGPASAAAACAGASFNDSQLSGSLPGWYVLADRLAYCRFLYHEPYDPTTYLETAWLPLWDRPFLPAAIRIEMKPAGPAAGGLPELGLTVPLRITINPFTPYEDHF
jgi:prepilin-type N-terminal cleavage/methylation domain-containing protein